MAYDEKMAERLREVFKAQPGVVEKKMFGGLAFMVGGNMSLGINGDDLMVRVGPDRYEDALAQRHARVMDFTGRPMKGFVCVDAAGVATPQALAEWAERGISFARSLPAK